VKVKYTGPARDYSGYGEANRHDIGALVAAGVNVKTELPSYVRETAEFGRLGRLAVELESNNIGYEYQILHTTPDQFKRYMDDGKYHIGRVFWETDRLPQDFAEPCKDLDEIWTGSQFNADAIRRAGIDVPIYVLPQAIDTEVGEVKPYKIEVQGFKFYTIFEWTERKNPRELLSAYWQEFQGIEGVALIIKTYVDNFSIEKRQEIKQQIRKLKSQLGLKSYAPVYLYLDLMDRHQVYRLHASCDAFVSSHRGEGWGVPQMEAMLMGKPVISTNVGGIHEYLTDGRDALLVPAKMVAITENTRNPRWYTHNMHWAEADHDALRQKMRWIFDHREEAQALGAAGHQTVLDRFSLEAVGAKMRERLVAIEDEQLSALRAK
jgi:glycosyltransferase involved in cell wall biosynthesis